MSAFYRTIKDESPGVPLCPYRIALAWAADQAALFNRIRGPGWKIAHNSTSIPYHLVSAGEVYRLKQLTVRNNS
jgi:hypothetical protein